MDCHDYDAAGAPPRPTFDVENDAVARALLGGGRRFDEPYPPALDPDEEPLAIPEPGSDPVDQCRRLDGSDEVERFADRAVSRCIVTVRSDLDGQDSMLSFEVALGDAGMAIPVTGLIFKERVRASGEIDRVRLIDWNGR